MNVKDGVKEMWTLTRTLQKYLNGNLVCKHRVKVGVFFSVVFVFVFLL